MAVGRGVLLLVIALVLGIVLLQQIDESPDAQVHAGGTSDTTAKGSGSNGTGTTTTTPGVTTTTAPVRAPKDVKVLTANGTKVKGAGSAIKDKLLAAQYNALAAVDAKATVTATVVYATAGFEREAAVIAQLLALPPTSVQPLPPAAPVADMKGANVLVVVGPELAQQAATTTTTKPKSSTTTTAVKTSSTTTSTTR